LFKDLGKLYLNLLGNKYASKLINASTSYLDKFFKNETQ